MNLLISAGSEPAMARKKNGSGSGVSFLLFAGLITWGGWPSDQSRMIAGFLCLVGLWIISTSVPSSLKYRRASKRVDEKLTQITDANLDALARRRAQLIKQDPYGNIIKDKWMKEIDYFISINIISRLDDIERTVAVERIYELIDHIERAVEAKNWQEAPHQTFHDDMTPIEYEHHCADELSRSGWDARVTMASRDQGVDVIAQKSGIRAVIQCKLYKKPVGNAAVQEVAAARAHERADYAIVVSNNSYTQAAEELAQTNNVVLIHHRDLAHLDKILSIAPHKMEQNSAETPVVAVATPFMHEEVGSSYADSISSLRKYSRIYYSIAIITFIIATVYFLTRNPSRVEKPHLQLQIKDEKREAQITAEAPAANATSSSRLPTPETGRDSNAEARKSSPHITTTPPSNFESTVGSLSPEIHFEKPSSNIADGHVKGHDSFSGKAPALLTDELPSTRLAFRCRPVISGTISSVEISISGGGWEVSHITKKGARIERVAQFNVIDTSDGRDLSWQGVHRRNQELKMVAYLSRPNAQGSRIYKEEIINANTGKVAETTAICEASSTGQAAVPNR